MIALTQEKHLLFLFFHLFCKLHWIFFLFPFHVFSSLLQLSILLALRNPIKLLNFFFFFLSYIFYCCHKPLPLCWAFAVLWSFSLFKIFKIYYYYFLDLFLCLLFLLFFSPCSYSLMHINLLYLPLFNFVYLKRHKESPTG